MKNAHSQRNVARHHHGFTVIELMITLVIVAILASVAIPSYQNQVRASRRSEAREALAAIQAAQERWRSNNVSYATLAALGLPATSTGGNYALSIAAPTATGYTATATAQAKQSSDSACAAITLVVAGNALTYGPLNSCWGR